MSQRASFRGAAKKLQFYVESFFLSQKIARSNSFEIKPWA
jgi:hypothetical protein